MKILLILRHAKSSWKHPELADYERPLNKRGKRDAPRMGRLLCEQDLIPDLIISSSAQRARKTTEMVAQESGYGGEILFERGLYAAWPDAYIEALVELPESVKSVLVVGHNPGLEDLIEALTGAYERMPTAALAFVKLPIQRWDQLAEEEIGELVDVWRPKELEIR
jgi:phosphohistidine phosphatase